MHTTIRRYEGVQSENVPEIIKRVKEGFVPLISSSGGFKRYQFLNAGNGVVITISVFETEAAAWASNKMAASWVEENLSTLLNSPTQIAVGEALIEKSG